MISERDQIASEVTELESLLATIPEGRVIDRISLRARLESAREALAQLPLEKPEDIKALDREH
jgi:hypothetical protein